jgi:hypothetical protein
MKRSTQKNGCDEKQKGEHEKSPHASFAKAPIDAANRKAKKVHMDLCSKVKPKLLSKPSVIHKREREKMKPSANGKVSFKLTIPKTKKKM